MQYNTLKKDLIIPEYGRHIHRMVGYCKTIEDREERNLFAEAIIEVMGNLNTYLRDVTDFQHKLWDQLFIMAEFDLDVDSPFPIPDKETFQSPPQPLKYPKYSNKYRYYGRNIKKMIDVAIEWEEGDKKLGLVKNIANQMKKSYLLWNKDQVDDQVIYNQLKDLSNGKLDLEKMEKASDYDVNLSSKNDLTNGRSKKNYSTFRRPKRGKRRN